jgi:hypothetical protein
MFWHKGKPPEHGSNQRLAVNVAPILRFLYARLNVDGEKGAPVVGFWSVANNQWRLAANDTGTELIVEYWAEIPQLPPQA